jgi:hypothetical protein
MDRINAEQWEGVRLDILAQAYMEVRRDMWSILAARIGEKWQMVETKVIFHPEGKLGSGLLILCSAWKKKSRICHKLLDRQ